MSRIKNLPKSLPTKNPYFSIDLEGELTKKHYEGDFETSIPNIRTQTLISKYKAFLNGGFDKVLDASTLNIHHMVAYCKTCLEVYPEWFKDSEFGLELYDLNVLDSVYEGILEKEREWYDSVHGTEEDTEESVKEEISEQSA